MRNARVFLIVLVCFIIGLFIACPPPDTRTPTAVPTASPTPAPYELKLAEFQTFETNGAHDWKAFSIGEEHFLIVANNFNNTSSAINSKLYKWNGYNFGLYQNIATRGATDWEYFSIGEQHFLAVTYYGDGSYNLNSEIYSWNALTKKFINFQSIATQGALDWEYFSIGDEYFLVVANRIADGGATSLISRIYKWVGSSFTPFQENIETHGAHDWEFFTINNHYYLVVADEFSKSVIYRWNGNAFDTTPFQEIDTYGAYDWEFFTIGEIPYLVVANGYNGSEYNIDSRLYKWDNTLEKFVSDQAIPTHNASDFQHFTIGEEHFLAIANYYNGITASYSDNSAILKWNGTTFDTAQPYTIPTIGAVDWEYFAFDNERFLVVTNYRNDSADYNQLSVLYKILD